MKLMVYFSDFFEINPDLLEEYGSFDVSLINDLPLFIDPFLLFNSSRKEYQVLHDNILRYLSFLREKAQGESISDGLLKAWYMFPEIKQNWFGFCKSGNEGSGLGKDFAVALHDNLNNLFSDFGRDHSEQPFREIMYH
jgi:hypothetical protein